MPTVQANGIDINYEVQGEGEPMVLIPYLGADQACYAFQVAEYAKYYTCFSVDLRGAGLSGKPDGIYTTELFADDATSALGSVRAPTLITFGGHDMVTSTRFAAPLSEGIADSEVLVFEDCAHAPIYEDVEGFNAQTLAFLQRH
jgi:pimeloyl-ACP methyl ester carboxylesterase